MRKAFSGWALAGSLVAVSVLLVPTVQAATIWTNWTGASAGAPGTASGSAGAVNVTYLGELDSFIINGSSPIWAPNSSFIGGSSTTSPSTVGDDLRLNGNFTGVNTINFGSPVENPLIAIWSLGQPGLLASFIFNATPTVQAGGPNSIYGGSTITVVGNTVNGNEGNGVVQFAGTFSAISWTNSFENYYAFTVGVNDPSNGSGQIPEPSSVALVGLGLAGLALRRARRRSC